MKKNVLNTLLSSFVILIAASSFSQNLCGPNLVPNHDMELSDPVLCPSSINGIGQLWIDTSQVIGWMGTSMKNGGQSGITPDHYNDNCTGNSSKACMQGSASLGMYTSTNAGAGTQNTREYIQCELNSPLNAGSTYYIKMTVASGGGSFVPSDAFGAWFRQDVAAIDLDNQGGNTFMPQATPQFENAPYNYIDQNCQVIEGYFCADGGENWLMIGNFKEDFEMNILGSAGDNTYVIVDEVYVQEVCPGSNPELISLTADQNPISCGQDVTVTGQLLTTSYGTVTFNWLSPGSLSGNTSLGPHTETLTENTNYVIEYTATGACGTFTQQVDLGIEVNSGANISLNSLTDESCIGACDGAIDVSIAGGTAPYVTEWFDSGGNSVGTTNPISALCADTYTYEVTTTESVQQTNTLFTEDFESGQGSWILNTNPTGGTNSPNNNLFEITNDAIGPTVSSCDPSTDFTLNLGCQTSCNGSDQYDNINTSIMAESPIINTTGHTNLNLTFEFLAEDNNGHCQASIYYNDGGGWTFLANLLSGTCWGPYNGWDVYNVTLPAALNNNPNAQIGFHFSNDDYIIPDDWGIGINNISLTGETPIAVVCTEIDTFNVNGITCGCVPPTLSTSALTGCTPGTVDLLTGVTTSHVNGAPTVSFHTSQGDADADINPVANPVSTGGTYYVRSEDPLDGSCYVTEVITITFTNAPDAGTNGAISFCSSDPAADLFNSLGGTPDAGGTWAPALTSGTGVFDPGTDAAGTYTYSVTNSCGTATADVVVTITNSPSAGTNGSATFCTTDAATDLFNSLGGSPDAGGTWTPALTSGTGIFDPAVDAAGTYTYTVNLCGGGTSTADVDVTINPAPNAGTNGSINFCSSDPATDLFNSLGGTPDAGGTWAPALTSGTGVFDPGTDAAGTYTYTISNSCGSSSADVTVTILNSPSPGTNGTVSFCSTDAASDLFNLLGGSPDAGGTWTPALTSGTGVFDPTQDAAGTYTYTQNNCGGGTSSADVIVSINPSPNSGSNGNISICASDPSIDLFNLLGGTPDAGGTWSPTLTSGTGVFDPAVDASGAYTYTVSNSCGTVGSIVDVTVVAAPDAGTDGNISLCTSDAPTDLFNALGGTPDAGGTWSPALTSGTGIFDPATDADGTYTYILNACGGGTISSTVTVTLSHAADAGTNGTISFCDNDPAADLFAQLGGSPDAGGTWSPALASGNGNFDPTIDTPGTYTYTVTSSCGDATSTVDVSVSNCSPPVANFIADQAAICLGDCIQLNDLSTGGVTAWNWDFGGAITPNTSTQENPIICPTTAGTFTITLEVTNLFGTDLTSQTITVSESPNITLGPDTTINMNDDLFLSSTVNVTGGSYSWTPEETLNCADCAGTYATPFITTSYVVTYTTDAGCFDSDTILVNVNFEDVIDVPNGFSPNGDGNNDFLFVKGQGITGMIFKVYNRYGQKVFESSSQNVGWDGTVFGVPENPGVFVWYLEYHLVDGTAGTKKGNVTLIK